MTIVRARQFQSNQHDFVGQSTCRFDALPEHGRRMRVHGGCFLLKGEVALPKMHFGKHAERYAYAIVRRVALRHTIAI